MDYQALLKRMVTSSGKWPASIFCTTLLGLFINDISNESQRSTSGFVRILPYLSWLLILVLWGILKYCVYRPILYGPSPFEDQQLWELEEGIGRRCMTISHRPRNGYGGDPHLISGDVFSHDIPTLAAVLDDNKRNLTAHELTAVELTTLIGQNLGAAKQALGEVRLFSLLCQCRRPARSQVAALELITELLEEESFGSSHKDKNTCKRLIVQEDFQAFQSILTHGSAKAKELTVTILLMLSRAYKDNSILGVLFKYQLWELLFSVIEDSSSTDLAVEYAMKTVRNLTLNGDVMAQMEPKRVIKMLVGSIRRHDANASIVHMALLTLERFVPSGELCEPSNVHVLVSLLGRWEGETELLHSTVVLLGRLATGTESRSGGQLCKIMLDYGASQYLRTMLTSNDEGKAGGGDYIKDTRRLLTWLVIHAPRRSPVIHDLRRDSVAIESIKTLKKTDPNWENEAFKALCRLK